MSNAQYIEDEKVEEEEEEVEQYEGDEEYTGPGEQKVDKPSKDEYKIAKWMKKNVKTKKTKFLSHNVEYFTSNKAIDCLMKSNFATGDNPYFVSRENVIEFLDIMLDHKFFHRAKKVPVTMDELRAAGKSSKKDKIADEKEPRKPLKEKNDEKKDTEGEAEMDGEGSGTGGNNETTTKATAMEKKEKRKRKIRLDMHPEQIFVDGSEAYVWIYDPIPLRYWVYGLILLLGAIGICLFPLWPPMLRKGVYYLSVAAGCFLVFILALTVVRLIIFTIVWAITKGKLHFWIFPNLTEDVGFFASFCPLYESNYVNDSECSSSTCSGKSNKRSKSNHTKKKDKDSDAEDDITVQETETITIENRNVQNEHSELRQRHVKNSSGGEDTGIDDESHSSTAEGSEVNAEFEEKVSRTPSESESEISGKDYEIISTSEVQNVK